MFTQTMNMSLNGITRPMLAGSINNIDQVKFPCWVQSKEDGIRCFMINDLALSRTFKLIPNLHVRKILHDAMLPDGLDGELLTIDEQNKDDMFNLVQSKIMTIVGAPKFVYRVFDLANNMNQYSHRQEILNNWLSQQKFRFWLQHVDECWCESKEQLENLALVALNNNKEGLILRSPGGYYKSGRSTLNEGYLLKLKPFEDAEGIIIDFEELMINCNEQKEDNLGLSKRSLHKDNLEPGNTLGALIIRSENFDEYFKIGSGFTQSQRQNIWDNKNSYLGKTITFKFQKFGMKNKPRCPIFKGFRRD